MFLSQWRTSSALSVLFVRKGLFVSEELARIGAPTPDDPESRFIPERAPPRSGERGSHKRANTGYTEKSGVGLHLELVQWALQVR